MNNTNRKAEEEFQNQESQAMLQLLEMSSADVEAGRVRDSDEVFADLRRMIAKMRETQE